MNEIPKPVETYLDLMIGIRQRFDLIDQIRKLSADDFRKAETTAFHGRKIVEGIAIGCLAALENGLKHVPRDTKKQWNAEKILRSLAKKELATAFPSPSKMRSPTDAERASHKVAATIVGQPGNRISVDELCAIYQRLHRWLHQINPYLISEAEFLETQRPALQSDIEKLRSFIEKHLISIHGEAMFCTLWDDIDGRTKVQSLSKQPDVDLTC